MLKQFLAPCSALALVLASGTALAGQPVQLTEAQMDNISAAGLIVNNQNIQFGVQLAIVSQQNFNIGFGDSEQVNVLAIDQDSFQLIFNGVGGLGTL